MSVYKISKHPLRDIAVFRRVVGGGTYIGTGNSFNLSCERIRQITQVIARRVNVFHRKVDGGLPRLRDLESLRKDCVFWDTQARRLLLCEYKRL